jgi:hypothetical protein
MFSDKMRARLAGLALIGAVFAVPGAASAGVVVKSSGPSAGQYPVGRQVSDTATISLRAGDKITVLTDNGTKVMQGPGDFVVGQGATRTRSRFSTLSRRGSSNRARTGAVRGAGRDDAPEGPQPAPNLWFITLGASGNICLYDFDRVRVWREEANSPQNYTIVDQTSQTSMEVNFVETEPMRAWDPAALPLQPGRTYTVTGPLPVDGEASGTPLTSTISFVALTEDYPEQAALAQALIDKGCTFQLGQLADELEAFAESAK